jgi:hypothetical protein
MTTFSDSAAHVIEASVQVGTIGRLRTVLRAGAVLWFLLLAAGFFAPGGWQWGLPGPVGHMENYVISLWFVALVLAPLLASRNPLGSTGAIQGVRIGGSGDRGQYVPRRAAQVDQRRTAAGPGRPYAGPTHMGTPDS